MNYYLDQPLLYYTRLRNIFCHLTVAPAVGVRKRRPMVALLVLGDRVRATACVCTAGARNEKVVIRNSAPRCGGHWQLSKTERKEERERESCALNMKEARGASRPTPAWSSS